MAVDDSVMGSGLLSIMLTCTPSVGSESELGALVRDMKCHGTHRARCDVENCHMAACAIREGRDLKGVDGRVRELDADSLARSEASPMICLQIRLVRKGLYGEEA